MNYDKYAKKYPAILGMLLPIIATCSCGREYLVILLPNWNHILIFVAEFVPIALVYASIGYFARETFRSTSKMLFQFPLFQEDETNMPTTKMLLHSTNLMSKSQKKVIAEKVQKDFGIKLLSASQEKANMREAKLTIVDAVGKIRNVTRQDPILLQYNVQFGFCRNYLGASVWSLLFLLVLIILLYANILDQRNSCLLWLLICFQILIDVIFFVFLKYRGNAYARQLFHAYLSR